ncbi:MAG: TM0106 family RecB-like putative nuclease [Pseudomonadales bacterium]|nr:TM0106 family RecB-like putative nuclease [Pseudomonadales bacterium]
MTTNSNTLLIKPSDAKSWSSCIRRAWLDNKADFKPQPIEDAFQELLVTLGNKHEQDVLDNLARKLEVHTASSPEHTQNLIAKRVPLIYQAQLKDESKGFIGFPDFLILHESGEYQAADAKLSMRVKKKEIQIQLGFYRLLLDNPLPAIVFLGDGQPSLIGNEADAVTQRFIAGMRDLLGRDDEPQVHYSHSKCRACPYYNYCKPQFETKRALSLLYGVPSQAAQGLENSNIHTIEQLAATDPVNIPDLPHLKKLDKKKRAVLQAKAYLSGKVIQLSPVTLPQGHWVHFDIEDNPLADNGERHVYLWGFLNPGDSSDNAPDHFEFIWSDHESEDEQSWRLFLAKVADYHIRYPDLILAHYSNHERATIRSYATKYKMENDITVLYLLGEDSPLFDIQKPVLDNLILPLQGYGLKDICKHKDLVNFQWSDDDSGSQWSIVQFKRFLEETDAETKAQLKTDILGYNRDDVMATRALEIWLRGTAQ